MTKLTLSVPEQTVEKAKRYAKLRGTSVSAFFTQVVDTLPDEDARIDALLEDWPEMRDLVGLAGRAEPFDERSARILEKHG